MTARSRKLRKLRPLKDRIRKRVLTVILRETQAAAAAAKRL